MRDPYYYPDTEILRNRLGIMDEGSSGWQRQTMFP